MQVDVLSIGDMTILHEPGLNVEQADRVYQRILQFDLVQYVLLLSCLTIVTTQHTRPRRRLYNLRGPAYTPDG